MEAYHSQFVRTSDIKMCGIVMLPIRTEIQGPAKQIDSQDIIDEALQYFRANIFFKNYTINDPSDVLMIYLTLFIQYSLKLVEKEQKLNDAKKKLLDVSREFVNRPHVKQPKDDRESDNFSSYIKQIKEELVTRLINILFDKEGRTINFKFWMGLNRNKFLQMEFNNN